MKVFVVDDHSLFRDGIISLLEAAGHEVVGQAGNGSDAITHISRLRPELVLLDILMPGINGIEVLHKIKTNLPGIKVVMLTVSEEDQDLFTAIKTGADGYLVKNLNAAQFLEMLDGLERGEAALTRHAAAALMKGFAQVSQSLDSPPPSLSEREKEILEFTALGMSNKTIANHLSVSENTIKFHMRNIMHKLSAQNRTEAVTEALRLGILPSRK